jgi:hypothetical protein
MTRAEFGDSGLSLSKDNEVMVDAAGNTMTVVRVLGPYAAHVIVASPL